MICLIIPLFLSIRVFEQKGEAVHEKTALTKLNALPFRRKSLLYSATPEPCRSTYEISFRIKLFTRSWNPPDTKLYNSFNFLWFCNFIFHRFKVFPSSAKHSLAVWSTFLSSAKSTLWIFTMYGLKRNTRAKQKGIKVLRGRWRYRCMLLVMWKRSSSDALMEAVVNELMPGWCQFNLDDSYARTSKCLCQEPNYSLHVFMITTALAMILRHSSRLDINCAERYRFLPLKKYLLCRLQPPTHSSKLWFPQKAQDCVYFSFSNSFFILIVALARKCFRKMFKLWKGKGRVEDKSEGRIRK